jgi:uncharacterized membrane protein YczE
VHAPPRLRGSAVARLVALVFGLFLFALGIVAYLESKLGLSPWDVLHQGISRHTALSFGEANIAVGVVVVLVAWLLGARIGLATVANATLVGFFVDRLTAIGAVDDLNGASLGVRIGLVAAGVVFIGLGSGLYLGADYGAGPRDSLMVVGARRLAIRIAAVRGGIEILALVGGIALGGTIGVGTVVFALTVGPSIEASFWLLDRIRLTLARPTPSAVAA